ncbi:GNAT family N-acetyltransferase [Candidatus Gottesmanbacteria bacterium]|nr:GNAT family N-acetyltransferase [Candidatus Gottesmanbacteria bacterium]
MGNLNIFDISKATPHDASSIESVNKRVWLTTYVNPKLSVTSKIIKQMFKKNDEVESNIQLLLKNSSHIFLIAKYLEKIVGYVHAAKNTNYNEIIALYIVKAYQRCGIGTLFLKQLFNWFDVHHNIYIEIVSYNSSAICFYAKHGFKPCDKYNTTDTNWNLLPSGKRLPVVYMCKSI